jgi:hypothetical protein
MNLLYSVPTVPLAYPQCRLVPHLLDNRARITQFIARAASHPDHNKMFSWRTFQLNPHFQPTEKTLDIPDDVTDAQCSFCSEEVFTPKLYHRLSLHRDERCNTTYQRKVSDLPNDAVAGCRWCLGIGNAILLGEAIATEDFWAGPVPNAGESMDEQSEESNPDRTSDLASAEVMDSSPPAALHEEDDKESGDEICSQVVSPIENRGKRHLGNCAAMVTVTIEFLREKQSSLYTIVKARIEIANSECSNCAFPELIEDDCLNLTYDTSSEGRNSTMDDCPRISLCWLTRYQVLEKVYFLVIGASSLPCRPSGWSMQRGG